MENNMYNVYFESILRSSAPWINPVYEILGLIQGNGRYYLQATQGKSALPTATLVHSQCMIIPERSCRQELRTSGRSCSLHICITNPSAFIPVCEYLAWAEVLSYTLAETVLQMLRMEENIELSQYLILPHFQTFLVLLQH